MPFDPTHIIGEVLGQPAEAMRNPVNAGYNCPYINSICTKRSQRIEGPYPICSIWKRQTRKTTARLVCTCPKRFFEADIVNDVLDNCWIGPRPSKPRISYEVQMKGFGMVDFVISEIDERTNSVIEFISVELQSVDITGSVEPAYNALINSKQLDDRPKYGFNWANVRKRYISQLVGKGFYHYHWKSKMVAVLQTVVYEQFRSFIEFEEVPLKQGNINFLLYDFVPNPELGPGFQSFKLNRCIATSHSSLMMGALYKTPPHREKYCEKILQKLN